MYIPHKKPLILNFILIISTATILYYGTNLFVDNEYIYGALPLYESAKPIFIFINLIKYTFLYSLITNLVALAEAGYSGYSKVLNEPNSPMYGIFGIPLISILIMPIEANIFINIYWLLIPLAIVHSVSLGKLVKYYATVVEKNHQKNINRRHKLI